MPWKYAAKSSVCNIHLQIDEVFESPPNIKFIKTIITFAWSPCFIGMKQDSIIAVNFSILIKYIFLGLLHTLFSTLPYTLALANILHPLGVIHSYFFLVLKMNKVTIMAARKNYALSFPVYKLSVELKWHESVWIVRVRSAYWEVPTEPRSLTFTPDFHLARFAFPCDWIRVLVNVSSLLPFSLQMVFALTFSFNQIPFWDILHN